MPGLAKIWENTCSFPGADEFWCLALGLQTTSLSTLSFYRRKESPTRCRNSDFNSTTNLIFRMNDTLTILLTHQPEKNVGRMLDYWIREVSGTDLWVVHGGNRNDFDEIDFPNKSFADGARLRTRDHQREKQSYSLIFGTVAKEIVHLRYQYIWFMEYDHIPLIPWVIDLFQEKLQREHADVVGYRLSRIDQTLSPHYLNHLIDPTFLDFFRDLSVRRDKTAVLTMLGSGSFWRREAFDAVANVHETTPIYLEIFFPSVAHHLGFRVREITEHNAYVLPRPAKGITIEAARRAEAWTFHPHKTVWDA